MTLRLIAAAGLLALGFALPISASAQTVQPGMQPGGAASANQPGGVRSGMRRDGVGRSMGTRRAMRRSSSRRGMRRGGM